MEPLVTEQTSSFQEIQCCGKDSVFSFPVHGSEVVVNASEIDSTEANTASNKVKVSQISKFEWEERFYHGNLVSCNSSFVAYIIKSKGDKEDHVRVINHHTSSRLLLRGPQKKVVDLCFESFKSNQLACVDSEGTLFVFEIIESEDDIKCNLILQISRQNINDEEKQRVIWAPNLLLPMDTHESMIAISNSSGAEVYDLKKILESLGEKEDAGKEFDRDDLTVGVIILKECHTKAITCLALSPDTNVLATCSLDGDVKFWSIEHQSCLHEWEPHDGEPVTSLFFCDNLLVRDDTTPFWRYLMTGTSMSSVLKVWCAVKWECLQTIEFAPYTDQNPTSSPSMKLALDISAKFLIMADIHRPVLYICHLHQDSYKEKISVVSVSEFILKEPLLSFSIFVARKRRSQLRDHETECNVMINGIDADTETYNDEINENTEKKIMTSVTLFAIQKSAIQKLSIKFCTTPSSEDSYPPSISTTASSQEDVMSIRDALSDIDVSENFTDKMLLQECIGVNESSTILQLTENTESSLSDISTLTLNGQLSPRGDAEATLMEINNSVSFNSSLVKSSLGDSFADVLLRRSSDPESLGDSFANALRKTSDSERNDITSSVIGPLTNGLTSLSIECDPVSSSTQHDPAVSSVERDPAIISLERDPAIISLERDPAILHAVSIPPSDERESLRVNSDAGTTNLKPAVTSDGSMTTTDQLLMLLNNQQQVLNNQQQVLVSQQHQLNEIKEMMKQLISKQTSLPSPTSIDNDREDVKVYMQLLQKSTTSQFSKASKEFNKSCSQRLDQFLSNLNTMAQQKEEHNIQTLQNIVSNTIAIKLEKTVKQEMKQTVLSSLEKMHTKYMDNVNNQIAQKLSIWERTLKEETKELLKSKPLVESIGASAAGVLQGTIPNAFQECFQRIILPGFEKALMAIFMQMDRTFREGTKQYVESITKQVNSNRQEAQDPLIVHMQELIQSFQATADRLTSGVETNLEALMQKQLQDALENMQNNFSKSVESRIAPSLSESIMLSLSEAMEDFKRKIGESMSESMYQSQQQQATNHLDKKARIMALVDQGNYSKAFEEALSAANLPLVMLLCNHIEPNSLFQNSENTFPQPIILSLIHQLSGNLTDETEIKRRYLEESIMALDRDDEITREHLPVVLQGLNGQLGLAIETLIRTDSTNMQLKPLKMLLMASRSLLQNA